METFESLQNLWARQEELSKPSVEELIKKGENHIKKLKNGQLFTTIILSSLIIVLVVYFIYIGTYTVNKFTVGLSSMISVILLRVILEVVSIRKLRSITPYLALKEYSGKMQHYYRWRKRIHTVIIPVIYILYTIGFTLLLPAFKANMSNFMYWYSVISGYGFLTLFALALVRILKKETELLKHLLAMDLDYKNMVSQSE
jgi:hypothetical protein